jgi:hypothetical protein
VVEGKVQLYEQMFVVEMRKLFAEIFVKGEQIHRQFSDLY